MNPNKKILVTGGAGYIGSHTVIELYKAGYMPIIVDNLCNTSMINLKGINKLLGSEIKWYNYNCTNYNQMKLLFDLHPELIGCIHFAAFKSVGESVDNPQKYYKNNIGSLEVLLKCMNESNLNNLIFSSSCTVYGTPDFLPVTEDSPFKIPESPYGETKQECEKIISKNKITSISLRYFNPIGTHKSGLIGDCSNDLASNLVPVVDEVAVGIRKKIIVNGSDYNTIDGTCVRDYIHVEDLAVAHVKALDFLLSSSGKYVFNVGTGIGQSVLQIIKSYEKVNNIKIPYEIGPRRQGDVEKIYADGELIKKVLNWFPKKTLDEALKNSYNWIKNKNK
jgi:UDP-glucose 4-epimerase